MSYRSGDVTEFIRNAKAQRKLPIDPDATPMIEVIDLWKSFGDRPVLKGVNLRVMPGQIASVIGSSGGGKSTLLKCLIGAIRPDRGEIFIDGQEITRLREHAMNKVRRKYGVLFQSAALFNSLSVAQNVALPIKQHTNLPESTVDVMVKLKLELVGLRDAVELYPSQISGGMKKRVGLARAIALDPQILFFDEPSAGLDPIVIGVIDKLTVDLTRKLNITSLVITHEMRSAYRISDVMFMLHNGEVVASGTPDEFQNSTDPLVIQFVNGNADGPIASRKSLTPFVDEILAQ